MRNLYIVVFLMFFGTVSAQSRYVVYKTQGDVLVNKFRTQEWVALRKSDAVVLMDMVKVPEGGLIVVLDNKNRNLYKIQGVKEKSVKTMIDDAVRRSNAITSNLNKELLSGNSPSRSSEANTRLAATFRGMNESVSYLDSLALFISGKTADAGMSDLAGVWYFDNQELSDNITCSIIQSSEEESYFSFSSKLSRDVFVNVIYADDSGRCALCYEFDYTSEFPFVLIPAGEELSLPQYRFAPTDGKGRYYVLVTDKSYDSHALQAMLNR